MNAPRSVALTGRPEHVHDHARGEPCNTGNCTTVMPNAAGTVVVFT